MFYYYWFLCSIFAIISFRKSAICSTNYTKIWLSKPLCLHNENIIISIQLNTLIVWFFFVWHTAPNGNGGDGNNGYNYQQPANDFPSNGNNGNNGNNGYPSGRPQNDYQPAFDSPQQQPQPSRPNNQYIPPAQNRPNGNGNGNFNPQTGYRYWAKLIPALAAASNRNE